MRTFFFVYLGIIFNIAVLDAGLIHIKVLKTRLGKIDGLVMLAAYAAFLGLVVFS